MNGPADLSTEDLFARYWDDALTPAQADELERRLALDPAARERFWACGLSAVTAAEPTGPVPLVEPARSVASRRRFLTYLGGATAAGLSGLVLGRQMMPDPVVLPATPTAALNLVRVGAFRGVVKLFAPDEQPVNVGTAIPAGAVMSTAGLDATLRLVYPDGSAVVMAGNTTAALGSDGRQLTLRYGVATAELRTPVANAPPPPVLMTDETTLTTTAAATLVVGCGKEATEVGCHAGRVTVADAGGGKLADLNGGEVMTVSGDGDRRKHALASAPRDFHWDLSKALPDNWNVGYRDTDSTGPCVRPRFWYDPYHSTVMSQIRSNHEWAKGFVQVRSGSQVRVKYRADVSGAGQIVLVVRPTKVSSWTDTGVIEWNGTFAATRPGEFAEVRVAAADMLGIHNAPTFASPWVAFLVILNTYRVDLGLRVSEFRVVSPEGLAAGR